MIVLFVVGSVVVVADALVVTDEERLDAFVDSVTGEVETRRIDAALGYVDISRVPVEVLVGDETDYYEEGREVDLAERARQTLAPFQGDDVRLLQKSIEIDGERALVALRIGTRGGTANVQFRMVRRGDGWLVSRVRVL
jgi:hypothetical protein